MTNFNPMPPFLRDNTNCIMDPDTLRLMFRRTAIDCYLKKAPLIDLWLIDLSRIEWPCQPTPIDKWNTQTQGMRAWVVKSELVESSSNNFHANVESDDRADQRTLSVSTEAGTTQHLSAKPFETKSNRWLVRRWTILVLIQRVHQWMQVKILQLAVANCMAKC